QAPRSQGRGHRSLGVERGLRGAGAVLPRQARYRSGEDQCRRRRDCGRPSLRHVGRAAHRSRADRGPSPQGEICRGDHVRRRRHGSCGFVRGAAISVVIRSREDPMDLSFSKEEVAFRDEVRAFFRDNVSPATRQKLQEGRHLRKEEMIAWWRILNKKGWGVSHWPKEYGGTGWSSVQHYIFNEELQMAPAPAPLAFGVSMVGPVIYTFGNEQQKKQYLPRIANVDDWWCQGFSEPGSGSDLASLKTKAERKGDKYIINGQKTWTTLAQY